MTGMLLMVGVQTRGIVPTVLVDLGWLRASKEILCSDHLRGLEASVLGRTALISRELLCETHRIWYQKESAQQYQEVPAMCEGRQL